MKRNLYSVFDKVANVFGRPFIGQNDGSAVRGFFDMIKSGQDEAISRHPGDFDLVRIGEFDDDAGVLTPLDRPQFIVSGSSLPREE